MNHLGVRFAPLLPLALALSGCFLLLPAHVLGVDEYGCHGL